MFRTRRHQVPAGWFPYPAPGAGCREGWECVPGAARAPSRASRRFAWALVPALLVIIIVLGRYMWVDNDSVVQRTGLMTEIGNAIAWPFASVMTAIPLTIIYMTAQRFMVEGLTAGSVKG